MLISTEFGGICNRIKSLVSTLRMDPNARVFWPWHEWCCCQFNDLFVNDLVVSNIDTSMKASGTGWRLSVLPEDIEIPIGFSRHIDNNQHAGRCIDHEYHRIPISMRNKYLEVFSRLIIQPNILANVAQFHNDQIMGKEVVAVHLRTWKVDPYPGIRADRTAQFITQMRVFPIETIFLISADCDEAVDQLRQAFPNRIITYPRKVSRNEGRKSPQGQVEDFTELLLLTKCPTFLASDRSTYSELIWWFGECKANVIVP